MVAPAGVRRGVGGVEGGEKGYLLGPEGVHGLYRCGGRGVDKKEVLSCLLVHLDAHALWVKPA
jgi:hypothetical protein